MAANITQYTGRNADTAGKSIGGWIGLETEYTAIAVVSNPDLDTYNPNSPDFYPEFKSTLFYIVE